MGRLTLAAACVYALGGCVSDLHVDDAVAISCRDDADCPGDWHCRPSGRCVRGAANTPPSVIIGNIARTTAMVAIPIVVFDAEGDDVALAAEAEIPGRGFVPIQIEPSSAGGAPDGAATMIAWDAARDLGASTLASGLRVQLTPSDGKTSGGTVSSEPFSFGNDPPVLGNVRIDLPSDGKAKGNVVVRFDVADSSSDLVSLSGFVFSASGDFSDAMEIPLSTGAGAHFPSGALLALTTTPSAREYSVTWSSLLAAPIDTASAALELRVRDDLGGESSPARSAAFVLDNATQAPTLVLGTPGPGAAAGDIAVDFVVDDGDGDPCLVAVEYSADGGDTWTAASSASDTTSLLPGMYTYVWQSTQLGFSSFSGVLLRFSVRDSADVGEAVTSTPFAVENGALGANLPPLVFIESTHRPDGGRWLDDVHVVYRIVDQNLQPCSVTLRASLDGGTTWFTPTRSGLQGEGTSELSTSSAGVTHVFVWNALLDTPLANRTVLDTDGDGVNDRPVAKSNGAVHFEVKANDGIVDSPETVAAFAIGNDAPVLTAVNVAPGAQHDLVVFDYTLVDPLADPVTLQVDYTLAGGVPEPASVWLTSTMTVVGDVPERDSSALGESDNLAWTTVPDVGELFRGSAHLTLRPRDRDSYGTPLDTVSFELRNNTPPSIEVTAPAAAAHKGGLITVGFTLTDASSDPCQVLVEYSTGGAFATATTASTIAGLSSSPTGEAGVIIWNSAADLNAEDEPGVVLRLTPSDPAAGAPVLSPAFRADNVPPAIVSYTTYDLNGNGSADRVEIAFSETIAKSSLGVASAFRTATGIAPTAWDTPLGGDDDIVQLEFAEQSGTQAIDLTYLAQSGKIADLAGNRAADRALEGTTLHDEAAPRLIAANTVENPPYLDGLDPGDAVELIFSEPVVPYAIDAVNVDATLQLSGGHSWVDGSDNIGAAAWSPDSRRLNVMLSASVSLPTVVGGDTVSVAPGTIVDADENEVQGLRALTGTFSKQWRRLDGSPPPGHQPGTMAYDSIRDRAVHVYALRTYLLDFGAGREQWRELDATLPVYSNEQLLLFEPPRNRVLALAREDYMRVYALDLTPGAEAWTPLSPAGAPPPGRGSGAAIYDPINHRIVLYGGTNGPWYDDLWQLDLTTAAGVWSPLDADGVSPGPLVGHTMIYDGARHRAILYHGFDVYALDLGLGSETWYPLQPATVGRSFHVAAHDANDDRMLVYGGVSGQSEVYAMSLETEEWTLLSDATAPTGPTGRHSTNAAFDVAHDRLAVFAGIGPDGGDLKDTWLFSAVTGAEGWQELTTKPLPPPARWNSAAVFDPVAQRMLMFGGNASDDTMWALDLSAGVEAWRELNVSGAPVPIARQGYTWVLDEPAHNRAIMFGGDSGPSEAWSLSLNDGEETWTLLGPTGPTAIPRNYHAAVYDSDARRMVVCCGNADGVQALDLSTPGAEAWSNLSTTGEAPAGGWVNGAAAIYDVANKRMIVIHVETWALDFNDLPPHWSKLTSEGSPRVGASVVGYDAANNRVLVFSGSTDGGDIQNGLYALSLTPLGSETWTELSPSGALPLPRRSGCGVFDTLHKRLVVFSGWGFGGPDTWWY